MKLISHFILGPMWRLCGTLHPLPILNFCSSLIPVNQPCFPLYTPSTSAIGVFLLNSAICYLFSCSFDSVLLCKGTIFVFPAYLTIMPWRRRKHVSPKHWCLFTKPQTFSSEKKELLMHCCSHYLPLHNSLLWVRVVTSRSIHSQHVLHSLMQGWEYPRFWIKLN